VRGEGAKEGGEGGERERKGAREGGSKGGERSKCGVCVRTEWEVHKITRKYMAACTQQKKQTIIMMNMQLLFIGHHCRT